MEAANRIGYPVLVRPSFVLGGRAMVIVYNEEVLRKYMVEAVEASEERPVLIDRFLEDATELDVDCVSDGETSVIGAIMEHVELAGISFRRQRMRDPHNLPFEKSPGDHS